MTSIIRAERLSDPRQSGGRTLPQVLADLERTSGATTAIRAKRHGVWRESDWAQVYARVGRLAAGLAQVGLERGSTVAIISENIEELFLLQYASLVLGARVVCGYPDATAEEFAFIVRHSGAGIVIAEDQEQVDKLTAMSDGLPLVSRIIFIDGRGLWHAPDPRLMSLASLDAAGAEALKADPDLPARKIKAGAQDDVAVLCYTSGTTSAPKGAMLSHRFLLDNAYRIMAAHKIPPGAAYLSYISPAWATEWFMGFALGLLAPMTIHFAEKPETVKSDLREVGPEFLVFTPRQWEMMASDIAAGMMDGARWRQGVYNVALKAGGWASRRPDAPVSKMVRRLADGAALHGVRDQLGLSRSRAVLSGGAGLSVELFRMFEALGVPLRNIYGSTELGVLTSHWRGAFDARTMGEPLPSDPSIAEPIEMWLDETGELRVRSCSFSGYLDNEAAGAALGTSAEGFHTGDAARIEDRGELIFLDRLKDLRVLKGGARFPPQFIEIQLRASPFVKEVMAVGDETRPFVTALVNIDPGMAGRLAERRGVAYGTFTELSQLAEIREVVARAIAEVNRLLPEAARVRKFVSLPKELDADESELTRSRKLKRATIEERYKAMIEAIYEGAKSCKSTVKVTYQDGRTSLLDVDVAVNDVPEAA